MLSFLGSAGEALAVYVMLSAPLPLATEIIEDVHAIRGFHSVEFMVPESSRIGNLLSFMGYGPIA